MCYSSQKWWKITHLQCWGRKVSDCGQNIPHIVWSDLTLARCLPPTNNSSLVPPPSFSPFPNSFSPSPCCGVRRGVNSSSCLYSVLLNIHVWREQALQFQLLWLVKSSLRTLINEKTMTRTKPSDLWPLPAMYTDILKENSTSLYW